MAFTLEDGTGVTGANGYLSFADYTTHHTDRGRTVSDTQAVVEAAIVRASDYVDKRFGRSFRGSRQSASQGLEWPRFSAFDDDGYALDDVPPQLEKGIAEYARLAISGGVLAPNPPQPAAPEALDGTRGSLDTLPTKREKVGPIEAEYMTPEDMGATFEGGSLPEYPEADLWIRELTVASGVTRLVRS